MKYCSKCGKELMDEAVICPRCGCYTEEKKSIPQDYKAILRKTSIFLVIGLLLLGIGVFAWFAPSLIALFYSVIGEKINFYILGVRPDLSMYHMCDMLANWSSVIFFLAAEILLVIPREKFNTAFKRENYDLLMKDRTEYKRAAKEKNHELNKEIPCYKATWVLAVVACVLFAISVIILRLGM